MQNNHGFLWRLLNSWWIIPSFVFMTCVGFFYIGKKARKIKWILWGVLYLAVLAVLFYFDEQYKDNKLFSSCITIFYLWGIIHSFNARKEFLTILDASGVSTHTSMDKEDTTSNFVNLSQNNKPQKYAEKVKPKKSDIIIDVNSCKENDLVSLPGVSIVMAKRALRYREDHDGFSSVDEFFDAIQLKPHFVVQVQNMVECKPLKKQNSPKENSTGRKLDL